MSGVVKFVKGLVSRVTNTFKNAKKSVAKKSSLKKANSKTRRNKMRGG